MRNIILVPAARSKSQKNFFFFACRINLVILKLNTFWKFLLFRIFRPHVYSYDHNVSADMSFSQGFMSNQTLYLIGGGKRMYLTLGLNQQPLEDFTLKYFPTKRLIHCTVCPWWTFQSDFFGLINLMSPSWVCFLVFVLFFCGGYHSW